jgi:hypothetical protein
METETWLTLFLFLLSIVLWEGLFIWAPRILHKNGNIYEGFESSQTSKTVDLPINTTVSCRNTCGPQARCSITGQQCTSDDDCYGCTKQNNNIKESVASPDVRGQNDAGKLSSGVTYSSLTTDLGTRSAFYHSDSHHSAAKRSPPTYEQGINKWRDKFDADKSSYDKLFEPDMSSSSNMPSYPVRPTLTGEFQDNGPLSANDYL